VVWTVVKVYSKNEKRGAKLGFDEFMMLYGSSTTSLSALREELENEYAEVNSGQYKSGEVLQTNVFGYVS